MDEILKLIDVLGLGRSVLFIIPPILIGLLIVFFVKSMEKRYGKEKFDDASPTPYEIKIIFIGGLTAIATAFLAYTTAVEKEPLYITILFGVVSCFLFIFVIRTIIQFINRWNSLKK